MATASRSNLTGYTRSRATAAECPTSRNSGPDKRAVAQYSDRLFELAARIHHDRSMPGHRLLDRLAGDQQEAEAAFAGLNLDLVAAIEQYQRAVTYRLAHQDLLAVDLLLGKHAERPRRRHETAVAFENVSEGMPF